MSVRLEVVHANVLEYQADVLALKFAQTLFGVDARVVRLLEQKGTVLNARLPKVGQSLLIASENTTAAREILFVGVEPLGRFDYETIRRFASSTLSILGRTRPGTGHVAMTMHGAGFGLDETEAFRAELAGLLDAVHSGERPSGPLRISIVERDGERVARLGTILNDVVPSGLVGDARTIGHAASPALGDARAQLGSVGRDSLDKPHVFVAMPFAEEYADRFHYGIKGAANAAGFLCERADLASFTGDVIAWVKERIGSAALVVADLTTANPNVYLEVGYAWGRGVNTVLLVAEGAELKFDVRSQRCLVFRSIRHLEELLTAELKTLSVAATP